MSLWLEVDIEQLLIHHQVPLCWLPFSQGPESDLSFWEECLDPFSGHLLSSLLENFLPAILRAQEVVPKQSCLTALFPCRSWESPPGDLQKKHCLMCSQSFKHSKQKKDYVPITGAGDMLYMCSLTLHPLHFLSQSPESSIWLLYANTAQPLVTAWSMRAVKCVHIHLGTAKAKTHRAFCMLLHVLRNRTEWKMILNISG